MGLSSEQLRADLDALAKKEPAFGRALKEAGYPEPRLRDRGYETLLRTIVGQQISVHAAAAVWNRLAAAVGDMTNPKALLAVGADGLREAGFSRQKSGYALSLAQLIVDGELDLEHLPEDDEAAIAELIKVKGIGRWSAEIYLLFAEGRGDVWPAGDLAVQEQIGRILGHKERPKEPLVREVAEAWRPYRGAAAIFAWHQYSIKPI